MWLPYMCVIFLFIFHISQIWEFVYIPIMLYFACNDWYLVWFSSAYTSRKEKDLRLCLDSVEKPSVLRLAFFFFFFFFFTRLRNLLLLFMHYTWTVVTKLDFSLSSQPIRTYHALFTNPQISLFNNFFIKNGSHDTIHAFKNYFVTVFFSFQF